MHHNLVSGMHVFSDSKYCLCPSQFGPVFTEGNEAHVHHLLVYLCDGINETHVGKGGECEEGVPEAVAACRQGTLIAGWAVGGEVSSVFCCSWLHLCECQVF